MKFTTSKTAANNKNNDTSNINNQQSINSQNNKSTNSETHHSLPSIQDNLSFTSQISQEEFYAKYNFSSATLMMQQYLQLKYKHQDKILLFRLGDFYEIFYEDAKIINNTLHLTLTKRNTIPMCGIPVASLNIYLKKLIKLNYKIAICEQTETPEEAKKAGKKIVNRDVTKIITPGTVLIDDIHDETKPNYIGCLHKNKNNFYLTYTSVSTNQIYNIKINQIEEIEKLNIIELIIGDTDSQLYLKYRNILTVRPRNMFVADRCEREIKKYYKIISTINIPKEFHVPLGVLITYLRTNYKSELPILPLPKLINNDDYLHMNHITAKNLEIFTPKIGLLAAINYTQTRMGNRLLYQYLQYPLKVKTAIETRLEIVEFFSQHSQILKQIQYNLNYIHDIERFITLISIKKISIEQVILLSKSLKKYNTLQDILYKHFGIIENTITQEILDNSNSHHKIIQLIDLNIKIENDKLYIQHEKINNLQKALQILYIQKETLLNEYKNLTSIDNLKFNHNNILGYYIEITSRNNNKMTQFSDIFQHKQSTLNHVRYTTTQYSQLMEKIMQIEINLTNLQQELFLKFIDQMQEFTDELRQICNLISKIDVLSSFGYLAQIKQWIKPIITEEKIFDIINGYHPLIHSGNTTSPKTTTSKVMSNHADIQLHSSTASPNSSTSSPNTSTSPTPSNFIPPSNIVTNNCKLSKQDSLWIITGPNMGGKSTFLRQNALLILLSHIGCFVPAERAIIGITDNIFSRIGAHDNLHEQASTFMVEMNEISYILSQATERSFIIIDEVGRGTSHVDGIPLASAITDHIYSKIKCHTIIATHYHSMPVLSKSHYQMQILHNSKDIIFTYKIIPGKAEKSYGLNVAKLAGLPNEIIDNALKIQKDLNYNNIK